MAKDQFIKGESLIFMLCGAGQAGMDGSCLIGRATRDPFPELLLWINDAYGRIFRIQTSPQTLQEVWNGPFIFNRNEEV